jgi:Protein of unknown function (DUF742)
MRGERPGGAADASAWLDADAGPVVRSFAITGGRTRADLAFDLLTHVVAAECGATIAAAMAPEHREIVDRARRPVSIAELAGHLNRPLGVVWVLVADLYDAGAISLTRPRPAAGPAIAS